MPKKTKYKKQHFLSEDISMALLLLPFLALFALFTIIPMLSSIVLSFFEYDMLNTPTFTGIGNYLHMFVADDVFPTALKNTLVFAVITGPLGFMLAFILAWMLCELGPKTRSVMSFLFYSPALMGNVYFIWQVLFSGDSYGYINNLLLTAGIIVEPIQWFKDPTYTMTLIIIVQLWMSMGITFLTNISALQNIDPALYEAGAIDGVKNRWAELWYITLPSMKSIIIFGCVMQIQSAFSVGAICTTLAGFPSVNYSAETLVTLLTDVGTIRYEMGYACALSVFLFAIMAVTRLVIIKLINTFGK